MSKNKNLKEEIEETTEEVEDTGAEEIEKDKKKNKTLKEVSKCNFSSLKEIIFSKFKHKKKDSEHTLTKKHLVLSIIIGVGIGLIVGCLISSLIFKKTIKDLSEPLKPATVVTSVSEANISTYSSPHTVIEYNSEERNELAKNLKDTLNEIMSGPYYSQFYMGSGSEVAYMYNTKGEVFMQDSNFENIEILLNNKTGFAFNTTTGDMTTGEDIEALSLLYNSVELLDKEDVQLYKMSLDDVDGAENMEEYRIDIIGEDNVRALYNGMSDTFKDDMILSLNSQLNSDSTWEPHMITAFQIDKTTGELVYATSVIVANNTEYPNYTLIGYDKTSDWEIPEEWYTYSADSDPDGTTFVNLLDSTSNEIERVLYEYAEQQGWDLEEINQSISNNSIDKNTVSGN